MACSWENGDGVVRASDLDANVAASAQVYTVDPREHLRIDREAEAAGQAVIGVFHSHTHTDAYPVPDRCRSGSRSFVALRARFARHEVPAVRSYRIEGASRPKSRSRSLVSD